MVRVQTVIEPNMNVHEIYKEYIYQYETTYEALKDASKRLVESLDLN